MSAGAVLPLEDGLNGGGDAVQEARGGNTRGAWPRRPGASRVSSGPAACLAVDLVRDDSVCLSVQEPGARHTTNERRDPRLRLQTLRQPVPRGRVQAGNGLVQQQDTMSARHSTARTSSSLLFRRHSQRSLVLQPPPVWPRVLSRRPVLLLLAHRLAHPAVQVSSSSLPVLPAGLLLLLLLAAVLGVTGEMQGATQPATGGRGGHHRGHA